VKDTGGYQYDKKMKNLMKRSNVMNDYVKRRRSKEEADGIKQ